MSVKKIALYLLRLCKAIWMPVAVLCILLFVMNNYADKVTQTIKSDGIGYYDYLPSTIIHRDLNRHEIPYQSDSAYYERTAKTGMYVDYKQFSVNKYPCGVALLQLPFFYVAYNEVVKLEKAHITGYEEAFHKWVYFASLFYLFLGLFFMKKVLELYSVKPVFIFISLILLLFGTNLSYYATYESSFSHVYSFFAVSAWIYFSKCYFKSLKLKHLLLSFALLGLILNLRQVNLLVILFVPFLMDSKENFQAVFRHFLPAGGMVFANYKNLLAAFVTCFSVFFIQMLFWYQQTGDFLLYSYGKEGFLFLHPEIVNVLFSYRKGLFVYTPILIIGIIALVWLLLKKDYYRFWTWFLAFAGITYIIASWCFWFYGCSFGLRAFIEYYPFFFILIALMLSRIKLLPSIFFIAIGLSCVAINLIQTYQYNNYILHWIDMDAQKYWRIFLKTDKKYSGLVWLSPADLSQYELLYQTKPANFTVPINNYIELSKIRASECPGFLQTDLIVLKTDHRFPEENNTKITLVVSDSAKTKTHYYGEAHLLQFSSQFDNMHRGRYDFVMNPISDASINTVYAVALNSESKDYLKNVTLSLYRKKEER